MARRRLQFRVINVHFSKTSVSCDIKLVYQINSMHMCVTSSHTRFYFRWIHFGSTINKCCGCVSYVALDDFRAIFSILLDLRPKKTLGTKKNHFCKIFVVFECANFHHPTRKKILSPVRGLKGPKIARKSSRVSGIFFLYNKHTTYL